MNFFTSKAKSVSARFFLSLAVVSAVISFQLANLVWADNPVVTIEPQNVTNKPIKPNSAREVFSIHAPDTAISAIGLTLTPITNFSTSDLADLSSTSNSGVGLFDGNGQFIVPSNPPIWNGNQVTLTFSPLLPHGTYYLTLKFKPSIANGASFSVTIPENAILTEPASTNTTATTAPFVVDNANPTNPSNILAWDSAIKTTPLDPFKYYNFTQPYFEWSGATDMANVNGYFVYFGPEAEGNPLTGIRINHGAPTTFSGGPLPENTAGLYYLRAVTIDNSGNISTPTTLYIYKYDRKVPMKKPGAPVAKTPVTDTTPTWEWDFAFDPDSGVTKYQFFWVKENSGQAPFFADITSDPLLTNFTHTNPLDGGKWAAGVRAIDGAGNFVDSDLGSIIIDAPVLIPTIAPVAGNPSPSSLTSNTPSTNTASLPSPNAKTKMGDFNNDGKVDIKDFNLLVLNWKKSKVPQDINNDGTVDLKDFNTFAFNWNK